MPFNKLINYLNERGVRYVFIKHAPAFTAQEVAASAHIPGRSMVKNVIVHVDGEMKMMVLPSTHQVDFDLIKETLGAEKVELATEDEFKDKFPDCEVGAMPPFGNLYDMETLVAEPLTLEDEIAFNACNHKEAIKMDYRDYEDLVKPRIIRASAQMA